MISTVLFFSIGGSKWCIENDMMNFISKFDLTSKEIDSYKVEFHFSPRFLYELYDTLYTFPKDAYPNQIKRLLMRHFVINKKNLNKDISKEKLNRLKSEKTQKMSNLFMKILNAYKEINKDVEILINNNEKFIQNLTNLLLILYKIRSTEA